MNRNNEKQFDCIRMKEQIQKQIYTETKNMSKEELLNYFNDSVKNNPKVWTEIAAENTPVYNC